MKNRPSRFTLFSTAITAIVLIGLSVTSESAQSALAKRLVVIAWDGGADWVVDRLVAEGKLPNVARMAKSGVHAESVTTAFPSVTGPSFAAIWTGAWADINGVSANGLALLPRSAHTLLEQGDSFAPSALQAEPIWMTAALAGKRVVSLAGPHQHPAKSYQDVLRAAGAPPDRFIDLSGFDNEIAPSGVLRVDAFRPASGWTDLNAAANRARDVAMRIGDRTLYVVAFDSTDDAADGFDTVRICPDRKAAGDPACMNLKPQDGRGDISQWSQPIRISKGALSGLAYFRLFALNRDGSNMVLYTRRVSGLDAAVPREMAEDYLKAAGGLGPDAAFDLYSRGLLGPTLWSNGDGAAERRLIEIARLDLEIMKRGTRFAVDLLKPDLVFHYSSWSDSAGHYWFGTIDPASIAYKPDMAAKLQPFFEEIFKLQDAWLGSVLDGAGSDTVVSLSSDHGFEGVGRMLFPNFVFENAGLLALTSDRKIDLTRTKVLAPPWAQYSVSVNSTEWKGGIVAPEEREAVLRQAEDALMAVVDPANGRRVVSKLFRASDLAGMGTPSLTGGDLYIDVADGYGVNSDVFTKPIGTLISPVGAGVHGAFPLRPKMQAIWYATGPGLASGKTVGMIRQVDVAPTLCRILGIPAPKQAIGHVVGEALQLN